MTYLLLFPSNELLYKVYKAVLIEPNLISGNQYDMVQKQPSQPMIEVAINEDEITLTTQLKAPIQITTLSDRSEAEVPLLLNFNIPLPSKVCQSGEEIHHLPEKTTYTIECEHPNQLPLLKAAYKDCIAGAQAATA